jgi:hypothetical protein
MAFNLLNTTLNAKNTMDSGLDLFRNVDTQSLKALAYAGNKSAETVLRDRAMPTGLSAGSAANAAAAGYVATSTPSPTPGSATGAMGSEQEPSSDDIVVTGRRDEDNRLRLSALSGQEAKTYGPNDKSENILAPLYATGGLMFPYTPSIQVSGDTDWTPHALTHTNYDIYSYQRTPSATITLAGKFTVQNQREGEYALACIHFLRTMGKMYYGEQDSADYNDGTASADAANGSNAGLPPPVLRLRGYGLYMFEDIRCVLKGYSFSFEETMDLVTVQCAGGDIMLPPMFTINVSLLMQQNPTRLRKEFKLDDFRTGALMRTSKGWF